MVLGNANGIDLNNDTLYRISKVGGIGVVLATRIVQSRPIRRWSDLAKIEGFDREMIENLRGSGAKLGLPKMPQTSKLSRPNRRRRTSLDKSAYVGATRKTAKPRLARNIFSGEGRDPE